MPTLLGIETSGDVCSVAVRTQESVLFKKSLDMPYGQAGHLMGLLGDVMTEAQLDWSDVSAVAVNRGPGSFTGIRVGLSVAQGLSLAGNIPIFGLTGCEIYRSLVGMNQDLLILIDTRREDCFASFFKSGHADPVFSCVMSYDAVKDFCAQETRVTIVGNVAYFSATHNARFFSLEADSLLTAIDFYQAQNNHIFSDEPYYLREPEIHGHPSKA